MDYLPTEGYSEEPKPKIGSKLAEFIQTLAVFAAIAVAVYVFIGQPHKVFGSSMFPTLHSGDFILTDKITYRLADPKKGEIIVFIHPNPKQISESDDYIKRIIATPRDSVRVQDGSVYVNGEKISEPYLQASPFTSPGSFLREGEEIEVPADNFVAFGDNRSASSDSREWGFLTRDEIIGKAIFRYWPPSAIGTINF